MTTRKELQAWLDQFPEDAIVEVLTTYENSNGWESYTSVYPTDLNLTEMVDADRNTYGNTFEIERNGTEVIITLGVKN